MCWILLEKAIIAVRMAVERADFEITHLTAIGKRDCRWIYLQKNPRWVQYACCLATTPGLHHRLTSEAETRKVDQETKLQNRSMFEGTVWWKEKGQQVHARKYSAHGKTCIVPYCANLAKHKQSGGDLGLLWQSPGDHEVATGEIKRLITEHSCDESDACVMCDTADVWWKDICLCNGCSGDDKY